MILEEKYKVNKTLELTDEKGQLAEINYSFYVYSYDEETRKLRYGFGYNVVKINGEDHFSYGQNNVLVEDNSSYIKRVSDNDKMSFEYSGKIL